MPENEQLSRDVQLNPQCVEAIVGIRTLRKIQIYPLSMADQFSLTDIVTKGMQEFALKGDIEDMEFAGAIIGLIKENLGRILKLVTDEDGDKLLQDMSNPQGMTIAEIIFDMNYGSLGGNVKSLVEKWRDLFRSARPSPAFSKNTEDTDSKISSENPTEKED